MAALRDSAVVAIGNQGFHTVLQFTADVVLTSPMSVAAVRM